ncbi:MAG: hypothetical protein ACYTXA_20410, partial [Nostoc sp.]
MPFAQRLVEKYGLFGVALQKTSKIRRSDRLFWKSECDRFAENFKTKSRHQNNCGGVAPKFYLWGLAAGEFIRRPNSSIN